MATKPATKTAASKAAPATSKKPGTALVPWEAEMAARAQKAAKQEKPVGSYKSISIRGGFLKVDGELVDDNELDLVVVAALHENQFYTEAFDPNSPAVPACYAYSDPDAEDPEEDMKPHPEAEDQQHDNCAECPNNQWGSADTGRGKACKNVRRLMVVTADAIESADALAEAEMRRLNVPVMSGKNWGKFVRAVADDVGRDYSGVVCKLSTKPDPKAQFVLTFDFVEKIDFDGELWGALEKKREEAFTALQQPYPKAEELAQRSEQRMVPRGKLAQKAVAGKGKPAPAGKAPVKRTGKF